MSALTDLKQARAKIQLKKNWAANDSQLSPEKFCMVTALPSISNNDAYDLLIKVTGAEDGNLGEWNDTHSHEQVLAAFDKAIAEARS